MAMSHVSDRVSAMATVRIHAEHLDPRDVTALLGPEPETGARKGGSLRALPDGRVIPAPTGTWFITSAGRVHGGPAKHLEWAVDLVSNRLPQLSQLGQTVDVDFSLLIAGPEADAVAAFRAEAPALLPILQAALANGVVDIDLPTAGAELCFAKGEPIALATLADRLEAQTTLAAAGDSGRG